MAEFDPETDIKKIGRNYWVKASPGRLNAFLSRYIDGGEVESGNAGSAERFLDMLEYVAERSEKNARILTTCDVYVFATSGAVKIGIAADVADRQRRLQTAFHDQIRLVRKWTFATRSAAFEVEQAAHRHFSAHRQRGEWFAIAEGDAVTFLADLFHQRTNSAASRTG